MKKLLLLLLIAPFGSFAQKNKVEPIPKRATQIIISNDKTEDENFTYVTKYLISEAIDIASRDKELGVITTEVFKRGKLHPIALTILCIDSTIRVTGRFKSGFDLTISGVTAKDDFEKVENKGMRGSIYNKAFVAMNEISNELGTEITYK